MGKPLLTSRPLTLILLHNFFNEHTICSCVHPVEKKKKWNPGRRHPPYHCSLFFPFPARPHNTEFSCNRRSRPQHSSLALSLPLMSAQFTSIIFCPLSHSVSFLQFSSSTPDICFLSTSTSWFFWLHVEAQGEKELKEKTGCRNSRGKERWKSCAPIWLISCTLSKENMHWMQSREN